MKNFKIKILIVVCVFALMPCLFVKAQSANLPVIDSSSQNSLGVQPAIVEVVLNKDPVKQEITLYNLTNQAVPIKTIKEGFPTNNKHSIPENLLNRYDSSSWITLSDSDTDFIMQPNEVKKITLNIQMPADASPGGHYSTIYFQPLIPETQVSKDSAQVYARIAVLILLQTPGDVVEGMKINNFSLSSIYESFPLNLNFSLENSGNIHLLPTGRVDIYDDLTNKVVYSVDMQNDLTLPGLQADYSFPADLPYKIGKFSAQVVVNYGAQKTEIKSDRISFLIIPYKFLILLGLIILFLVLDRRRVKKAFKVLISKRAGTDIKEIPETKTIKAQNVEQTIKPAEKSPSQAKIEAKKTPEIIITPPSPPKPEPMASNQVSVQRNPFTDPNPVPYIPETGQASENSNSSAEL